MPGGWSMFRLFPSGGESLGAWAMLPFHDDTFYMLVDAAIWLAWLPALRAVRRARVAATTARTVVPVRDDGAGDLLLRAERVRRGVVVLAARLDDVIRAARDARQDAGSVSVFRARVRLMALTIKITALAMPVIAAAAMLLATRRDTTVRGRGIARDRHRHRGRAVRARSDAAAYHGSSKGIRSVRFHCACSA